MVSHPQFKRQNRTQKARVKASWRKPRGIDNKLRIMNKAAGSIPRIGYQGARKTRHHHPSGKPEVLVHTEKQLSGLSGVAVRLGGSLGKKKYEALKKKAVELKLHVVN